MMLKHLKYVAVGGKVTVQMFKKSAGGKPVIPSHQTIAVNKENIAKLAKLSEAGATVAVCAQKMDGNGRKKENVEAIRYLVVDLDAKTSMAKISKLEMHPSLIVKTSVGRYHLYYRVKCKTANYQKYARVIAEKLNGDPQATDLSRAFRIAGTINWKPDEPFVARLMRCERVDAISVGDLRKALGAKFPRATSPAMVSSDNQFTSKDQPSIDAVRTALSKFSSDDRGVWLHVGMALHSWSTSEGRALWDAWSKNSLKYDEDDQEKAWAGFKHGGGRSIATVFYYAHQATGHAAKGDKRTLPVEDDDVTNYAAEKLKDRLLIVGDDSYYVFRAHHWFRDEKLAGRLMLEVVKELYELAKEGGTDYAKRKLKVLNSYAAALRLLKGLNAFAHFDAKADDFDKNAELLGVPNGVVELRTKTFRAGRPSDMITITTQVEYDAAAKCPNFAVFLKSIMTTKEYRSYFRHVCGYWLVGRATEQHAFIFLGKGSNGKGTITRLVEAVLGKQYFTTISPSFMKNATRSNPNGPTPAIMPLRNARVVFCTESERTRGVDEVFFKQLTGNDTLTGRHHYGEQQSFTPPGKLVLTTNVMPDWSHSDDALWRRVKVLPFLHSFTEENGRDNSLDETLAKEASGILNFMILGAYQYLQDGFAEPQEVVKATKKARIEADSVNFWIAQECKKEKGELLGAKAAYDAYAAFTRQQKKVPSSTKAFVKSMDRLGFSSKRNKQGNFYMGLVLLSH